MKAVYVHVPFCRDICAYCDFTRCRSSCGTCGPVADCCKAGAAGKLAQVSVEQCISEVEPRVH